MYLVASAIVFTFPISMPAIKNLAGELIKFTASVPHTRTVSVK